MIYDEKFFTKFSNLYPLSNPKKARLFANYNTESYALQAELKTFIDTYPNFMTGRCYTNSTVLTEYGKSLGYKIEFYSGWLSSSGYPPIHHAWCVLDKKHLIDVSLSLIETEAFIEAHSMIEKMKENGREPYDFRAFSVRHANKVKKRNKVKKYDDIPVGKVPDYFIYMGSPDNPYNARKIYNDLMEKYPNHPSYIGIPKFDENLTQKLMQEYRWN
jgi:hypothetical protein